MRLLLPRFCAVLLLGPLLGLPTPQSASAESPAALIDALKQREAAIEAREKALDLRESHLKIMETDIKAMVDKYVRLKGEIDRYESDKAVARRKQEEERVTRLAKIYQSMPPKEAAARIGKMKESTALSLLRKIKEKVAAKILSNMPPAKATRFSERFIKGD